MYRRYRMMPFDMWACLALAVLLAWGTGTVAEKLAEKGYEVHAQAHAPVAGEIGGPAGEDVFRCGSVAELLEHDTALTVVSPGIEYRNRGGGYYGGRYFHSLTLPSGERVAAWVNAEGIQEVGGYDYYSSDKILPLGRLVYEDLEKDASFLGQIEYKEPLSRHDFYIDMVGGTAVADRGQVLDVSKLMTQLATVAVCYPLLHAAGSKLGLWRSYFPPKKRERETWD